jgi:predicted DNA-binding protein
MLATGETKVVLGRDTPMIGFRVTPEEHAELRYLAARLGMTISTLVRESVAYRQRLEEEAAAAADT